VAGLRTWGIVVVGGLAAIAIGLSPSSAAAHMRLTAPPPRTDAIFPGPCGSGQVTGGRTVFAPGETITMEWTQEIPHGGFYFVSFGPNDDAGFEDNVLLMVDEVESQSDYAVEVTLPECSCDGCTLQLWQAPASLAGGYYSCADIELRPLDALSADACPMAMVEPGAGNSGGDADGSGGGVSAGDESGGSSGATPPWTGTGTDGSDSDGGGGSEGDAAADEASGGCRVGGHVPAPAAPWGLLVVGVGQRRRRGGRLHH
jgi:uncharacterized protein (TIGR03382 family)